MVKGFVIQLENYFNSTQVYMTLSAYMLNLFEKENPDNLLKSVSLDQLVGIPTAIAGAPQCAAFKAVNDQVNFCFRSVKVLRNVLSSVQQLLGCRKGIPVDNGNYSNFSFFVLFCFILYFILFLLFCFFFMKMENYLNYLFFNND